MKQTLAAIGVAFIFGIVGCDSAQNGTTKPLTDSQVGANAVAASPNISASEQPATITVTDLMQSLDMRIFKVRINEPGLPTVKRVALLVKLPEREPSEVVSVELEDSSSTGTLRVFVQELNWQEYAYRAGIAYDGDDGQVHSGQAWSKTRRSATPLVAGRGSDLSIALELPSLNVVGIYVAATTRLPPHQTRLQSL